MYKQPKVVLYSHDTQGLGHIRRNLAIATALLQSNISSEILLISGTEMTTALQLPPSISCLTLPGIAKDKSGRYHARSCTVPLETLVQQRAQTIQDALREFEPDLFIVDKVPYGIQDELGPALLMLQARGNTRFVLGLRDVLDDPVTTRRDWHKHRGEEAVRDLYDAVWIYGDPKVFDTISEYGFSSTLAEKAIYTGYLNRLSGKSRSVVKRDRLALCQVGGGQDGFELAHAFANAQLPIDMYGLILTGPFMPQDQRLQLHKIADERADLTICEFTSEPEQLLHQAERVLTMGGYNSTCELLATNKHALMVPRIEPRLEQWIRGQRLQALGLIDVLHPESLTSSQISNWLSLDPPQTKSSTYCVDLDGLTRIPILVQELLGVSHRQSSVLPFALPRSLRQSTDPKWKTQTRSFTISNAMSNTALEWRRYAN